MKQNKNVLNEKLSSIFIMNLGHLYFYNFFSSKVAIFLQFSSRFVLKLNRMFVSEVSLLEIQCCL